MSELMSETPILAKIAVSAANTADRNAQLCQVMGKEVVTHFHEDAGILGGVIVRVGDRVFDGSIRRRMTVLRRTLLAR